ncbi:MAG: hypothetical protein P0Y53_24045 [Candidatus Pseudobacter hemicellulosilyticus]|uniref:Leucine rich repeat (LRR) protein n=1 Tax=Candidatus Pseudobacter hemicellulosilyticus TaxID=3121375 RepID=A0AAJ6BFX2_9BACT|nr:MAG: hypothetical protein P0Y53_24045 [Pseudobacter sp.]
MIQKSTYLLSLLLLLISVSCKKDQQGESINYNQLTEERILSVSEKTTITDADIEPLDRLLNERVTDPTVKEKLTGMLNSVKLLKDILPLIDKLRTDENINFPEKYQEVYTLATQLSDLLPRKAILIKELEDNKNGYDNEEVIFSSNFSEGMEYFLKDAYKILPIEGKSYVAFRRSDIDNVDSLGSNYSMLYSDLKKFTNLRVLMEDWGRMDGENQVINLNKFTKLESLWLRVKDGNKLVMDSLDNLKKLRIFGKDAMQRLDLTGTCESLEILQLEIPSLTTLIVPDKKLLTEIRFGETSLMAIDTVQIEGGGATWAIVNTASTEMGQLKLSGIKMLILTGRVFVKTGEWNGYPLGYNETTRIKEFSLTGGQMTDLSVQQINFPAAIDFYAMAPNLSSISWINCAVNASDPKYMETSSVDMQNIDQLEKVEYFWMTGVTYPENTILDLRKWKKIWLAILHSEYGDWEGAYQGPKLKKIIFPKGVDQNKSPYGDSFYLQPDDVEVEYVD